jgi:hypothetical protein
VIILAMAVATWVGLTIYSQGIDQAFGGALAPRELPTWEPAANHATSDRPEDAFQRAWNKSEQRAERALAREGDPE